MTGQEEINQSADHLVMNAVDTIRERLQDDEARSRLTAVEDAYLTAVRSDVEQCRTWLQTAIEETQDAWPMRLYLADVCLQAGDEQSFEREVGECLARSTDPFVVVSLFMFMTRLYVLRAKSVVAAVEYVRETVENNPSVAPYIRSIFIQTLLEAGEFDEAYTHLQVAVHENNSMLTIEGLEVLPMLLARLGRWEDAKSVTESVGVFAREQLRDEERSQFVQRLMEDVREREQLGDVQTGRFLMDVAKAVDDDHPDVRGYLSIGVQMPNGWWPIQ
ncbi:hypothetical protein [Alicyclobacillus fastidiosus]|uniref:Tetratricopeptide repeat protein n=1 Tax=Alicyclobacillus fastidiosus TaxID=392011 RepID=A0ABV5A966_9BACL|nr:hypothetical protein [Alicyclobacillus fastidiosus]WEH10764.1 hypothetical protein PYS47_05945 [Alicyclobacillus fastidiosus]